MKRGKKTTKRLMLLALKTPKSVWEYSILEFQKSLSKTGMRSLRIQRFPGIYLAVRCLSKLGLIRNVIQLPNFAFFVPIMSFADFRLFPVCYFSEVVAYCYDCWPCAYDRWEAFFKKQRIKIVFFSARQSAEYFKNKISSMESFWAPEACDPDDYLNAKPLKERDVDVLELGRRNNTYHDKIVTYMKDKNYIHLFETRKGKIIFPTRKEFLKGMGDSKIVISFPGSITHPERSGSVETVTHRYFQTIASKCLALGHCPNELKDIFGYSPVIEVDFNNPLVQITDILATIEKFQPFVDDNYKRLLEVGTWDSRVGKIISILRKRNYLVS